MMENYREVEYEFKGTNGIVLIGESVKKEQEIKEICFRDYLEKLSKEVKILTRSDK